MQGEEIKLNLDLILDGYDLILFDQYRQFLTLGGYDLVPLRWTDLRPQVWHLDQPWKSGNSISNLVIWYLWIHLKHISVRVLDRAHYYSWNFSIRYIKVNLTMSDGNGEAVYTGEADTSTFSENAEWHLVRWGFQTAPFGEQSNHITYTLLYIVCSNNSFSAPME